MANETFYDNTKVESPVHQPMAGDAQDNRQMLTNQANFEACAQKAEQQSAKEVKEDIGKSKILPGNS